MKGRIVNLGVWAMALFVAGAAVFAGAATGHDTVVAPAATNASVATPAVADKALGAQLVALQEAVNGVDSAGKPLMDPNYRQSALQTLTRVERHIEQKDYPKAMQTLDSMSSYQTSAEFRKSLKALSTLLVAQVNARQADQVKQVRAALAEIVAACAKAKSAADLQPLLSRIQQMQSTLSSRSDTDGTEINELRNNLSAAQDMIRQWAEVLAAENSGDLPRAVERLNQIVSSSSSWVMGDRSQAIRKLEQLQAQVRQQVEKAIQSVREAMGTATSADLQKAANEFNRQYERLRRAVSGDSFMSQMLENARNVIGVWLRVVAAEEVGNFGLALQLLTQVEGEYSSRMDLQTQQMTSAKRAGLVKKMIEQPEPAEDPIVRTVTEEIARADTIEKLLNLRRRLAVLQQGSRYAGPGGPGGSSDIQNLLSELQVLESWQMAVAAGQFNQLLGNPAVMASYPHRWKPVTARFLHQLRGRALSELAGLKDLKVADGQTPEQAALQMASTAKGAKDWSTLVSCLDAYRLAAFGAQPVPAWLGDGIQAARQMLAARRFEQAGDVERAAAAYMAVLTAVSNFAPVEDALAEIGRLQKDRPDILKRIRDIPPPPEAAPGSSGHETAVPHPRPTAAPPVPGLFQPHRTWAGEGG